MNAERGSMLVVDDVEANRDLLSRRLQRQGHTVAVAENGRQAIELLKKQPFDLILCDIMMPEMNGYQVLEHVKADPALRHIPVIMISALDDIDSVVRCIEMGAEDYLFKPFNPTLLKARISACLEKSAYAIRSKLT
jgi:Response regulator containing a CheY-like receiver domain and an HD-GYP domain